MPSEPHHCPPWCHECPDMGVIADGWKETQGPLDILMPWCQPGIDFGLDACICSHENPHLDANTVDRAVWFAAEKRRELARTGELLRADELRARRIRTGRRAR